LPRLRLSTTASYYDGEFDSDCADVLSPGGGDVYGGGPGNPGGPPVYERLDIKAMAVDQVFTCRWLADGDGYGLRGELTWAIDRASSIGLSAGYREIEMDFGEDYSNTTFGLSYRHRF